MSFSAKHLTVSASMALDAKRGKLFWLVFYITVSVLVGESVRTSGCEIIVRGVPWSSGGRKQISGMAKLVLYDSGCDLLQLHFSDDALMPANI